VKQIVDHFLMAAAIASIHQYFEDLGLGLRADKERDGDLPRREHYLLPYVF